MATLLQILMQWATLQLRKLMPLQVKMAPTRLIMYMRQHGVL